MIKHSVFGHNRYQFKLENVGWRRHIAEFLKNRDGYRMNGGVQPERCVSLRM